MNKSDLLPPDPFDKAIFLFTFLSVLSTPVSIAIAQSFLALAFLSWAIQILRDRKLDISAPPIMLPLLAFMIISVIASLFAEDAFDSLKASKKFVLFFIVFAVYNKFHTFKQIDFLYKGLFIVAGVSSIVALFQYRPDEALHRVTGFMGHWMTFSGLQMLLFTAIVAYVACAFRQALWTLPILLLVGLSILISLTRSVWLGVLFSTGLTMALRRSWLVLIIPCLAGAIFMIAPRNVTARAKTIFNLKDITVKSRLTMWPITKGIVRDHPLVGVGPNQVPRYVFQYGADPSASPGSYVHLHNNFFQLAAERGLLGLAAWLWFIAKLFFDYSIMSNAIELRGHSVGARSRRGGMPAAQEAYILMAGISGLSAFLVAGLFEYNFGDSEVLMLLLFITTAPYVLYRARRIQTARVSEEV